MDNCFIHHTELVIDLLKEVGIVVIFLPPYSPDYNPIGLVFGYIKAYLKHHSELLQALSDPLPVIKAAFESITPQQCQSHAGYKLDMHYFTMFTIFIYTRTCVPIYMPPLVT